jgi:hypothetical protein
MQSGFEVLWKMVTAFPSGSHSIQLLAHRRSLWAMPRLPASRNSSRPCPSILSSLKSHYTMCCVCRWAEHRFFGQSHSTANRPAQLLCSVSPDQRREQALSQQSSAPAKDVKTRRVQFNAPCCFSAISHSCTAGLFVATDGRIHRPCSSALFNAVGEARGRRMTTSCLTNRIGGGAR